MSAVDEHDQLNRARTTKIDERVEGCANRPSGIEHVVDEQDQLAVYGERNLGLPDDRLRADGGRRVAAEVVAVERDVERAARHVVAGDVVNGFGDAPRQRDTARADADESDFFDSAVAFENFVRDSR